MTSSIAVGMGLVKDCSFFSPHFLIHDVESEVLALQKSHGESAEAKTHCSLVSNAKVRRE
jgi:hypothetical protein